MYNNLSRILGLLCLTFICVGCIQRQAVLDTESFHQMTLEIRSSRDTNNGRPFYVYCEFTDFANFLVSDYHTIATLSSTKEEDHSSFITIPIIPGTTKKITANVPLGQSTAIYCLFTDYGEEWKHLIRAEEEPKYLLLTLGNHEIQAIETW